MINWKNFDGTVYADFPNYIRIYIRANHEADCVRMNKAYSGVDSYVFKIAANSDAEAKSSALAMYNKMFGIKKVNEPEVKIEEPVVVVSEAVEPIEEHIDEPFEEVEEKTIEGNNEPEGKTGHVEMKTEEELIAEIEAADKSVYSESSKSVKVECKVLDDSNTLVTIELIDCEDGYSARYTTNGKDVTFRNKVYKEPFTVSPGTIVKVVVFNADNAITDAVNVVVK